MARRTRLSIDTLPLYASDEELGRAIMGERAKDWPLIARLFEPRGLPKVDTQLGGLYVPAVLQFFNARHGVGGVDAPYPDASDGANQGGVKRMEHAAKAKGTPANLKRERKTGSMPPSLVANALPLYATDKELAPAILGKRAKDWPMVLRLYEPRGFPKISALTGGRYVPAVIQFFDAKEGVGGSIIPTPDGAERPWQSERKPRQRKPPKDDE